MIELKQVTKQFDQIKFLDNISLTIRDGSAYGLLGSNGAGKSTLLRLLCGIYRADAGDVLVEDEAVFDNVKVKSQVFFINDETVQFQSFTVQELRDHYKPYYPNFSEETFLTLMDIVKLPPDKKMSRFSKGMKRQAIFIVALACQTKYLLLDEAFDGLDPTMRIIVKRMLVDSMLDRNLTIVISSQNLKEVNELCDHVALLHKGQLLFSKDLQDIHENLNKFQVAFSVNYDASAFADLDVIKFQKTGSVITLIVRGNEQASLSSLNNRAPMFLESIPLSLEEIFIYEMEVNGYDGNGIEH